MRKWIYIALISLLLLPCQAFAAKAMVIRFNTVAGPQQPEVKGLEVFAQELDKLSAGTMKVAIFHSGQLGNQQTQTTGVMRGTIDMTFTDPNTLAQFDETLGLFGAAYLFRDLDHLYKVMEGPIGKEYFDATAKKLRLRPLDVWYLGTRQLNLTSKAAKTPADMASVKLRMPNSPQWIAMGRALGANPTPMGFGEIYLALKTGVIDGQDNPLPTNKAQKFYEVTKYIVLTDHQLGMLWPSISESLWQRMNPQQRGWLMDALKRARTSQNAIVVDGEARLLVEFEKVYKLTIVRPDIDAFRNNARKVYAEYEGVWGAGAYDKIQAVK